MIYLRWAFWSVMCMLLLGAIGFYLVTVTPDKQRVIDAFSSRGIPVEAFAFPSQNGSIDGVKIGKKRPSKLLLIHGSPGDWTAWKKLLLTTTILEHYQVIAINRLGYGKDNAKGGNLSEQSVALASLIKAYCSPCQVMGHSYGGALALRLGIDYPAHFSTIYSLAGTIAAPFQRPRWYNVVAQNPLVNRLLPSTLSTSNREMLTLTTDLMAMEKFWAHFSVPLVLWQGKKDVLVNPISPFYLMYKIPQATLVFDEQADHFMIWRQPESVVELLLSPNR